MAEQMSVLIPSHCFNTAFIETNIEQLFRIQMNVVISSVDVNLIISLTTTKKGQFHSFSVIFSTISLKYYRMLMSDLCLLMF